MSGKGNWENEWGNFSQNTMRNMLNEDKVKYEVKPMNKLT